MAITRITATLLSLFILLIPMPASAQMSPVAREHTEWIAESLREAIDGIRVELNLGGGSFKSQLKRADKSGAEYAVVLGDDEVAEDRAGLKPLRTDEDQIQVRADQVANELSGRLMRNTG